MADMRRICGESEEEYIFRVCEAKNEIGDWKAVADILNNELGYEYTESKYRKQYQAFCRMFEATKQRFVTDPGLLDEMEQTRIELMKERQRVSDHRREYHKLIRARSREEELNAIITEAVGKIEPRPYEKIKMADNPAGSKDLLVSLCDIHYGAVVDNYWGYYDSEVCACMMKRYAQQIIRIGEESGAENVYVWANGDLVSGNIHHEIE